MGDVVLEKQRVMLLVTENCNLNCVYCYEHQKSQKTMSFETAKKIIDSYLEGRTSNKPIVIEIFGGEAFANFPLIKQIDDYILSKYIKLNIIYEITTNGTLINGEIQEWLQKNKDRFFISVSLDGTSKMHNKNRVYLNGKGTFEDIDIEFFVNTWPGCSAKMTVSSETLPDMADGIIYLDKLGFKCDTTLSVGVDWDAEHNIPVLIRELQKLTDYYIRNPEKRLCTLLNFDLRLIFTPINDNFRFCGAGVDMVCCDTQGHAYPCQGFAPVSIGDQAEAFMNYNEDKFRLTDENPCKKCPFVRLCSNCYAANLQSTGNIHKIDTNLCKLYKLCILASATINGKRILMKKEMSEDDRLVLKAVNIIQNYFKNDSSNHC